MARRKKYPGHVERRGDAFRVTLSVDGKRHRFTVKTTNRERAEDEAEAEYDRLAKDVERRALGLPTALRMSELLDAYETDQLPGLAKNTQKTYQRSLDRFRTFFVTELKDPPADKIRPAHVRRYLSWREREDSVGARTITKDRATLSGVFSFAAKELEVVDSNPVMAVKPPRSDGRAPVILSEAEYDALLEACDSPMLRLYVLTLGETGARSGSEALWLRWEDVDLEEGFLWIASGRDGHRTKSGEGRWVPMTRRLREAMRGHFAKYRFAQYKGQRSKWVFHHPYARRRAKAGDRLANLRRGFEAAAARAADTLEKNDCKTRLRDVHQHDLRHRRVTTWLAEGADAVKVKEAVGHADLRTTMAYTHLVRDNLRSLVAEEESDREALKELGP